MQRFWVLNMHSAEVGGPFCEFIFGLSEDDAKGVLIDGVLAHGCEHAKGPGERLAISEVVGSILMKMLIEGIENGLVMYNFIVIGEAAFLSEAIGTF